MNLEPDQYVRLTEFLHSYADCMTVGLPTPCTWLLALELGLSLGRQYPEIADTALETLYPHGLLMREGESIHAFERRCGDTRHEFVRRFALYFVQIVNHKLP